MQIGRIGVAYNASVSDDGADLALTDSAFLVSADPARVAPLLGRARDERARLAAAAYGTSWHLHRSAEAGVRRDLLAVDAARCGDAGLAARIAAVPLPSAPAAAWTVGWATGAYVDRRLRFRLSGVDRAVVATAVGTAVVDGRPVAVVGDKTGAVRVWDLTTGAPRGAPMEGYAAEVSAVAAVEGQALAVTGDLGGDLRVWDLRTVTAVGGPLPGHTRRISAVATGPLAGRPVAVTGGHDDTLRFWDLAAGTPAGPAIDCAVQGVATAVLAGRLVAVTIAGGALVRVWDVSTRTLVNSWAAEPERVLFAVATAMLHDRPVVLTAGESTRTWDLETGTPLSAAVTADRRGDVTGVAAATVHGRPVAVSAGPGGLRMSDLATGAEVGDPIDLDWSTTVAVAMLDGRPVAVTHDALTNPSVPMWDLTAAPLAAGRPLGHQGTVVRALAGAVVDGRPVVVTCGGHRVQVWDARTGRPVGAPVTSPHGQVEAVAVAEVAGRPVAVTRGIRGEDGDADEERVVRLWDLHTGQQAGAPLTGHTGEVTAVATTTVDGRPVAVTTCDDGTMRVWDLATSSPVGVPVAAHADTVAAVATGAVGGRPVAVTAGLDHDDDTLRVWDLTTYQAVGTPMPSGEVSALATAEIDGRAVAIAGDWDGVVQVWDLARAQPAGAPMTGHTGAVTAVATADFGGRNVVVTGGQDATVRVWDPVTGRQVGPETTFPAQIDGLVAIPGGGLIVAVHSELVALTGAAVSGP